MLKFDGLEWFLLASGVLLFLVGLFRNDDRVDWRGRPLGTPLTGVAMLVGMIICIVGFYSAYAHATTFNAMRDLKKQGLTVIQVDTVWSHTATVRWPDGTTRIVWLAWTTTKDGRQTYHAYLSPESRNQLTRNSY